MKFSRRAFFGLILALFGIRPKPQFDTKRFIRDFDKSLSEPAGGFEVSPIIFDDAIIMAPLLFGEVYPIMPGNRQIDINPPTRKDKEIEAWMTTMLNSQKQSRNSSWPCRGNAPSRSS